MDIHKPKAVHGWRDLLKEVGDIVIGVVIALSGEQAVEALHWRHQAHAGEAALKDAYAREVRNAAMRVAQNGCITQRLATLSTVVQQASESGRLPPVGPIGHPPYIPWTVGT